MEKEPFFIVNTVTLVNQQTLFLERHTGLICKGYSGDMLVDNWDCEQWNKEIIQNQVNNLNFINQSPNGIKFLLIFVSGASNDGTNFFKYFADRGNYLTKGQLTYI